MNSSDYQQQQQLQQQQQQQQHEYDQSQIPAYDQSSQPYYYYDYNNNNNNNNNNQQYQFQQEPTSVHPPGVPIAPEPAHSDGPSQTQQLNPVQGAPVAGSLNPASVAMVAGALAQLSNYAGNVDGVQTAMYEQIGPSQYRGRGRRGGRPFRGGGRRGGRPFRGGGRGHFNHRGRAPYRGRGHGRVGGGRHFPSHSSGPAISNVADAPAAEATLVVQPSPLVSGQVPLPNPTQMVAAPSQPPLRTLWCEICKAECNSPEMLEQHMNGKRHKKNLLVHEELQRRKAIHGQHSGQVSSSQMNLTIQPENVREFEKKGCPTENMGSETEPNNLKDETELQNIVGETSELPAEEPEVEPRHNSAVRGRGFKRMMRGGRGSKYMRTNDGSRKPVEPKQAVSFICELCNVKCESPVAYNSHMTGKKHLSIFKRVHGHQGFNEDAGMQPLPQSDINGLPNSSNSQVQQSVGVQQGVGDPQVLLAQLLMTVQSVLSQVQAPATGQPSGPVAAQIQAVAGSSHEHLQNLSETQVSGSTAQVASENPTRETKNQLSSAPPELDTAAGSSSNTQIADGRSETEEKVQKLPHDSSAIIPADNPVAEAPTS